MANASAPETQKVTVGHPVDVASGSVFTAWHDFEIRGHIPIIWRRFYSTANLEITPLGRGWQSAFFRSLREVDGELIYKNDEGQDVVLGKPSPSAPVEDLWQQMEVKVHGAGYVIRDWHHHQQLYFGWRQPRGAFQLDRIEDLSGNRLLFAYDQGGRLVTIEQPTVNRAFRFSYNPRNLIERIELLIPGFHPEVLVVYEYDKEDRLARAKDALGHAVVYSYTAQHWLAREINKLGGSFYFEYDEAGRCTRTWGDGGYLERKLNYDPVRRLTRVTNTKGATTTYVLGAGGGVERKIDPSGGVTISHSVPGLSQKINAAGAVTIKEYDARCNLAKLTTGTGDCFEYKYNSFDQVECVIDPDGGRWPKYYDERGRFSGYANPHGDTWRLNRAATGEIEKQTDPEGRELIRRYDPALRWQELSNSGGHYRCEYDPKGRPLILSDRRGVLKMFENDAANRVIRDRLVDDADIKFEYNAAGNIISARYLNGQTWNFKYDAFSHVTEIKRPCGGVIRAEYDLEGKRTLLINERAETMADTYDPEDRLVQRKHFDGRIEKFGYDAMGHISTIERSDGSRVEWKYDQAGNLVEETLTGPLKKDGAEEDRETYSAKFEYDWNRRIIKASNGSATVEYIYNAAGRLVEEHQNDFVLRYVYDRSGKLIERELVDGAVGKVFFSYNQAGLPEAVSDSRGPLQKLEYDNTGQITRRTLRGGIVEEFSHDNRRRLTQQRVTQDGAPLVNRTYAFDAADCLTSIQDNTRGQSRWEYDRDLRLTQSETRTGVEQFAYENGDNLVQHNGTPGQFRPGSRLVALGDSEFEYDEAGNVISSLRSGKRHRYRYDLKGRLVEVTLPNSEKITFEYDALGRRLSKTTAAGKVQFVWSKRALAAIIAPGAEPVELLISSATYRPGLQWLGQRPEFFICDNKGTPLEVLDSKRGRVWSGSYSAFGKIKETAGVPAQQYCLRFPGQFEDRETGLFYNYHRYYDPAQGRYLTPDPIGTHGGLNFYDYPRDPINAFDPLGLSCPNPRSVQRDPQGRWEIFEHDNGDLSIRADCSRAFASRAPGSDPTLRETIHAGDDNAANFPEAHLGEGGRVIVMEGTHRSAAASRGAQIPPDPDTPHLGGVPGQPGVMEYFYSPEYNDDTQTGTPLQDLQYPPAYPHQLPP